MTFAVSRLVDASKPEKQERVIEELDLWGDWGCDDDVESDDDFSEMDAAQLRRKCKHGGLNTSGTKRQLIARLRDNSSIGTRTRDDDDYRADYEDMSIEDLRAECRKQFVNPKGSREALIDKYAPNRIQSISTKLTDV